MRSRRQVRVTTLGESPGLRDGPEEDSRLPGPSSSAGNLKKAKPEEQGFSTHRRGLASPWLSLKIMDSGILSSG